MHRLGTEHLKVDYQSCKVGAVTGGQTLLYSRRLDKQLPVPVVRCTWGLHVKLALLAPVEKLLR